MEERREGLRVKAPASTDCQAAFRDEQATPAVLTFLRDTEVGRVVILAPLGEKWEGLKEIELWPVEVEGQDEEGGEDGSGHPETVTIPLSFPSFISLLADLGRRGRGSPIRTAW